MNSLRVLPKIFAKPKQRVTELFRSFHGVPVLNQRTLRGEYNYNTVFDNHLFFTNLPKRKRARRATVMKGSLPGGSLIIECKRPELNYYTGMVYGKFDTVPLACKGWHHRKSKGDYFTILPFMWHPAFLTKDNLPDTFEENGISEKVIEQLKKINVTHPTVIQAKALRHLLNGHNLFMSAECGSGKTLAYVIALIENVLKWKDIRPETHNAPIGIILLPTRELAIQVGVLTDKLISGLGIKSQVLVGGNIEDLLMNPEMVQVDILICTLKVLLKHLKTNLYTTLYCKHVIIDEMDTFLDKSFINDIKSFLHKSKLEFTGLNSNILSPQSAQICFACATAPKDMEEQLFSLIKGNDMKIETTSYLHRTICYARQTFMRVSETSKPEELLKIVKNNDKRKTPTMIFSNKLNTATWVSEFLNESGVRCGHISARKYADDRLLHYRNFEEGMINVISCTDLASRGLSFTKVKHVINYEFPNFMADYIHRCGRTGRLDQGDKCQVTSFISNQRELALLSKIELSVRRDKALGSIYCNRAKNFE